MKIYHGLTDLPVFRNTVVTIGSFDGVHAGHQSILNRVKQLALERGAQSVVITFDPHPRIILHPDRFDVKLLTTLEEKIQLLESYGIDAVVAVPFTKAFSEQPPDDYIHQFLVKYFHPSFIVIGYDHRFGVNREGDMEFLKKFERECGYEVVEIERQTIDEISISSSKIRKALERSDVQTATKLLQHYFTFSGIVVKGQQIGREIGFPTANLEITNPYKLLPPHGIYAVFVRIKQARHQGMLYIGVRPVLKDRPYTTIEVNIFDFNQDIYGESIQVELVNFIRPDQNFDTLEDLVIQLADDEKKSKAILDAANIQGLPKIAIVILNYNGRDFLEQFLPSVLSSKLPNSDVVVADNASTDDSVQMLTEKFPSVKRLLLSQNHGFAKGYNEAFDLLSIEIKASGKKDEAQPNNDNFAYAYYILLNSDVRASANWLQPIVQLMESDKTIGACQPKILSFRKKRFFEYAGASGGWIDALGYPFSRGRIFEEVEKDRKQYDSVSEIFWASGAAMFIRAELYHQFGGLDEDYFAHQEEIDLCWRLKRAGYKIMVHPGAYVRHVGGGALDYTNPRKTFLNFRNNLFTIIKNEPFSTLWWLFPTRLMLDGTAGAMYLAKGQFKNVYAIIRAHFAVYGSIGKLLKKKKAYDQIIRDNAIGEYRRAGIYPGSVVFQYYLRKKRRFSELKIKEGI